MACTRGSRGGDLGRSVDPLIYLLLAAVAIALAAWLVEGQPRPTARWLHRAGMTSATCSVLRDGKLATGLHAFLTQFLDRVNELGAHISREFLVPAT